MCSATQLYSNGKTHRYSVYSLISFARQHLLSFFYEFEVPGFSDSPADSIEIFDNTNERYIYRMHDVGRLILRFLETALRH